jgi:pyridinium-3,5-biscarboxylic acid mononucleotide synthase
VAGCAAVTSTEAVALLQSLLAGKTTLAATLRAFQAAPVADLGFAQVDLHRSLRKGFPEVVYGEGKTPNQVTRIVEKIAEREGRFLVTRAGADHARAVRRRLPAARYHETARCLTYELRPPMKRLGLIAVLAAGTSDLPVAEEAAVTAEIMGNTVERFYDVGVAGLHRLLRHLEAIQRAQVVIAVAGMEGALPSVVGGLVNRPVIAVPTNVGYGAHLWGLTPLFGMLTSCASGLTVVNINNGFGAAYAAAQINALVADALSGSGLVESAPAAGPATAGPSKNHHPPRKRTRAARPSR